MWGFVTRIKFLEGNKAKIIDVFGDSELVVNQVNGSYQTKHPRMRAYRNEFWDMLGKNFIEDRVMVIPIIQNQIVESLATITGNFKVPIYSKKIIRLKL